MSLSELGPVVWALLVVASLAVLWPALGALAVSAAMTRQRGGLVTALMAASLGIRWAALALDGWVRLPSGDVWLHAVPLLVGWAILVKWLPEVARNAKPRSAAVALPFLIAAVEAAQYGARAVQGEPASWPGSWWVCAGLAFSFWASLSVAALRRLSKP